MRCSETHRHIVQNALVAWSRYFRFNVEHLGDIGLEEWDEFDAVTALTERYMNNMSQSRIDCIAILLQHGKTLRALNQALADPTTPAAVIPSMVDTLATEYNKNNGFAELYMVLKRVYEFIKTNDPNAYVEQCYCEFDLARASAFQPKFREAVPWMKKTFSNVETRFGRSHFNMATVACDVWQDCISKWKTRRMGSGFIKSNSTFVNERWEICKNW